MADLIISETIDSLMQAASAEEARDAISASFAGTEIDTAGLRAIPATAPTFDTYVLDLDTDTTPALTFTDPVATPASGYGYALKVIGAASSDTVITIPSSYSEENQANITTITVRAAVEFTCYRVYRDGRWHIYGDPSLGGYSNFVKMLRAGGASVVAETFPCDQITTSVNLSDGSFGLQAIYVDRSATISTIKWYCSVNANFTADNNNKVGLYSVNMATKVATLVGSSASANLTWDQSVNTWTSRSLSVSVDLLPGWYYVGYLYNSSAQTTAPGTGGKTALVNAAVNTLITDLPLAATLAAQTDLPSSVTLSATTASTSMRYFQIY